MKKILLPLVLVLAFTSNFAQSKKQMDNRIDEASIPKDVLNKEYVLLVKIPFDTKTWIEKFTKVMEEHYTGKFEVVPYKKYIDENYADVKKYKYILAVAHSLSKKDFTGANAEIANEPKGIAPTSAWSKDLHMVNRQKLAEFWNTNLYSQSDLKVVAYFADRLSGKEGKEED